jgi:hypothetical protein
MDSGHVQSEFGCHQRSLVVENLVVSHRAVYVVRSEKNLSGLYTTEKSVIGSRREVKGWTAEDVKTAVRPIIQLPRVGSHETGGCW